MKQTPVLTERDMKRVLQHVARGGFPARNRCLLILSLLAGTRVAEIAALRFSDVVSATGEVRPEIQLSHAQTKGNAARTVLVGSQLQSELEAYLRSLPEPLAPDWIGRRRISVC
jgi:integrase/recombinase XerD